MTERGEKREKEGRDEAEFSPKTRELIARRAGYRCSMPDCARLTVGPAREQSKSSCKGVACHIYAAAGRGPRGTGGLSEDERSLPENGIWLCSDHASLIDKNNGKDYPPEFLISYKALHEARVGRELGGIYSPLGWDDERVGGPESGKRRGKLRTLARNGRYAVIGEYALASDAAAL